VGADSQTRDSGRGRRAASGGRQSSLKKIGEEKAGVPTNEYNIGGGLFCYIGMTSPFICHSGMATSDYVAGVAASGPCVRRGNRSGT
jgi:hypothetical protein